MEIIGQQVIPASRDVVWAALNNPEVLKACLPGCESVELTAPHEFKVAIKAVIGPLRARFQGHLRMSEVNAPSSCVMDFEGQGGAVGFGKGSANVSLHDTAEGTQLRYEARAQVGGKLAQVGSRLIDSVVKKMTDDFFKAFRQQLAPDQPSPDKPKNKAADAPSAKQPTVTDLTEGRDPSQSGDTTLVPGWWLAPAALLGALIAIAAGRWMH